MFWKTIVRDLRRHSPILSWDQKRDILKEKYVPAYYIDDLLDQFLNLRHNTYIVTKYMSQFEALMLRFEVDKEQRLPVSIFLMVWADMEREVKV